MNRSRTVTHSRFIINLAVGELCRIIVDFHEPGELRSLEKRGTRLLARALFSLLPGIRYRPGFMPSLCRISKTWNLDLCMLPGRYHNTNPP